MHLKSSFPISPDIPQDNAINFLLNRPEQAHWPPDFSLYVDAETQEIRTYGGFRDRVTLAATAFQAPLSEGGLGIQGEIVGIISNNSLDFPVLIHSLLFIATPFALILTQLTAFELEHALKLTRATLLFVDSTLLSKVTPVAASAGILRENIYVLGKKAGGHRTFDEVIAGIQLRQIPLASPRPASADTLAGLIFTSGTTGHPKGVMLSHGNIIFQMQQGKLLVASGLLVQGPTADQEIPLQLVKAPMFAGYGLQTSCFAAFLAPRTFIILRDWSLDATLEAITKYKITVAPLNPLAIYELVNHPHLEKFDLTSIRSVWSGGSYLPPELLARLITTMPHKFTFVQGYAASELSNIVTIYVRPPQDSAELTSESVGMLLPGVEARIVRDDGSEADYDEVGELYIRSGCVVLGYWQNEKATHETFVDGWFRSGDLFRADKSGRLFFVDRAGDVFKAKDTRHVSPTQIEDVLLGEPKKLITDVTVAGVRRCSKPDLGLDEKVPRAWIVLSDEGKKLGADTTIGELEKWSRERLSPHKWLTGGIEVVDKIPKSHTGKALRRVLRDKYEESKAGRGGDEE